MKKKSFDELVKQMNALQESKQGKLKGGFSAFGSKHANTSMARSVSVSVSVSGDPCSCNCSCGKK